MARNPGETKAGTSSIAEDIKASSLREVLTATSLTEMNAAFARHVAVGMLERWKNSRSMGPRERAEFVKGAIDAKRASFDEIFPQKYDALFPPAKGQKRMPLDRGVIENAWKNVMKNAPALYEQMKQEYEHEQLVAAAPPLPAQKPPVTPAEEELLEVTEGIELIPEELPQSLKPEQWTSWRGTPLNNDTIGKLNYEFGHALARELSKLSEEQVQEVRRLYEGIVSDMYATTYPGGENPRDQIERALESYWRMLLESTRLSAPAAKSSK